jgi:hypothetical protein
MANRDIASLSRKQNVLNAIGKHWETALSLQMRKLAPNVGRLEISMPAGNVKLYLSQLRFVIIYTATLLIVARNKSTTDKYSYG